MSTNASFFYLYGMPNQSFPLMWQRRGQLFFPEGDERTAEWSEQTDQGTWGGAVLESVLLALHLHALSLIHCLPPSLILPFSVSFPSSHILLSSSTYFLGGGCRSTSWAQWEKHKAKLGQILHAAQITLVDCTLSCVHCNVPSFCTSSLFCALVEAPRAPHQHVPSAQRHAHNPLVQVMHLTAIFVPLGQVVQNFH